MGRFRRKPDEMERAILARAQRNAYLFLAGALLLWSLWESRRAYLGGELNLTPCLLLVGAVLVQTVSQLVLARRAVQDDEDSYETGPLARLVVFVCLLVSVLAMAVAAWAVLGVRR